MDAESPDSTRQQAPRNGTWLLLNMGEIQDKEDDSWGDAARFREDEITSLLNNLAIRAFPSEETQQGFYCIYFLPPWVTLRSSIRCPAGGIVIHGNSDSGCSPVRVVG